MFGVLASDIDKEHHRVWIAGREAGARKNPYRKRWVYLPDFFWDRLEEFPTSGKAFLAPTGKPYAPPLYRGGQYKAAFETVVEAAGVDPDLTPYDLRHTWASLFYAATRNVKALTILGGWADRDVPLETYVRLMPATTASELLAESIDYGQVLDKIIWEDI